MLPWLLHNSQIQSTASTAASRSARRAAEEVTMGLEARIESLELACAGLWQLLKFKLNCTDDELIAAVRDVDAKDGHIDGKIGVNMAEICPSCNRPPLTRRSKNCNWCGAELGKSPL